MPFPMLLPLVSCLLTLPMLHALSASDSNPASAPLSPVPRSPDHPLPAKKHRGAPPGNLNALKHGYYARSLSARASRCQQATPCPKAVSLHEEIDLFRIIVRHVALRCRQIEDIDQELRYVSVLGHSLATLSRLVKTQQFLESGETDQVIEQLELIITELTREPGPPQLPPDTN